MDEKEYKALGKYLSFDRAVKNIAKRSAIQNHRERKENLSKAANPASGSATRLADAPLTIALDSSASTAHVMYYRRKEKIKKAKKHHKKAEKAVRKAVSAADKAAYAQQAKTHYKLKYDIKKSAAPAHDAGADPCKDSIPLSSGQNHPVSNRRICVQKPPSSFEQAANTPNPKRTASKAQKDVQKAKKEYAKAQSISKKKERYANKKHRKAVNKQKKAKKALHAAKNSKLVMITAVFGIFFLVFAGIIVLMSTSFGILFSNSRPGEDGLSIRQVVLSLNKEYADEISRISAEVANDEVTIINPEINWSQILTVYAVKTTEENAMEVISMDEKKEAILRKIFWDMTQLSYTTEQYEVPNASHKTANAGTSTDETEGTEPEPEPEPELLTRLIITVQHTSPEEIADSYGLSARQKQTIANMLDSKYDALWRDLIYGVNIVFKNGWVEPLEVMDIISPFGYRVHPITGQWKLHSGVDLTAPEGTPILAMRDGTVLESGWGEGNGNYVRIDHGDGFVSASLHMLYTAVQSGQRVSAGDIIGYVGQTGWATGPHLHLGVTLNGEYIDPMQLFDSNIPDADLQVSE